MHTTHSLLARLAHWLFAIAVVVLGLSGIQIFLAFPSFDAKLPSPRGIPVPDAVTLGGWLGGALDWHLTFAWFYSAAMLLYAADLLLRGGWRRLMLKREELPGIKGMARYYLLRGPRPAIRSVYNPLQKATYLGVSAALALSLFTGWMLLLPVQFAPLGDAVGGWQSVRFLHFLSLAVFAMFLPGHLLMVALAGVQAMRSMLTGRSDLPVEAPSAASDSLA